jgi:hypothetical protein
LRGGAVAVVEAVMVASLALALPARALLGRARAPAWMVLAAVVLWGGVAVFAAAARPVPAGDAGEAAAMAVIIASWRCWAG